MRSTLHLPNTLRRTSRTRRATHSPAPSPPQPHAVPPEPHADPLEPSAASPQPVEDSLEPDLDACKVREAGGPLDMAAYVCLCGFAFAAAVSTSVQCPHCGAPQAW